MNVNKKILALLAIFCVIVSAGAVSAAEDVGSDDNGWAGSNYEDMNGYSGSQYNPDDEGLGIGAGAGNDTNFVVGGASGEPEPGNGLPLENETWNMTGNNTVPAAGEPASNATGNSTGNATTPHTMLSTGNPVFALCLISAVLSGYALIRRDN